LTGGTYNYEGHDPTAAVEEGEPPAEEMEGEEGEENEEDQMAAAMKNIRWVGRDRGKKSIAME
jgi:hypothetical protein